ncbi:MAG: HDOD domain-containing protein [Nannocystaceae bacterium]|nr:HDOD domain-containing protein [Nannocystaceae bacterium]
MNCAPDLQRRLERRVDSLPVLPKVARKLMVLNPNQHDHFDQIRALIEADASFSARILSAANSAAYANRSRITSVRRALSTMGSRDAANVIMAVALAKLFSPRSIAEKSLWRHSLQVATAVRTLIQASPQADLRADEAYTAGLLHDMGQFVLMAESPDAWARVNSQSTEFSEGHAELEREAYGMTHAEVGAMACERWRLPEPLVSAVSRHHDADVDPRSGPVDLLLTAVRFTDFVFSAPTEPGNPRYQDAELSTIEAELLPQMPSFFDFDAGALQVLLRNSTRDCDLMCRAVGI